MNIALSQGAATISGTVTREDDGTPINWVIVASYDLTGHLTGFSLSGIDPSTNGFWQPGRYEVPSLVPGSRHSLRTWNSFALMYCWLLNPDVGVAMTDEWYDDLQAVTIPWTLGSFMPFASQSALGFMPFVEVPEGATQVVAGSSGIDFALGFLRQGAPAAQRGEALRLERVTLNPCDGRVALGLTLTLAQPVRVELFDMAGRLVGGRDLGLFAAGSHRLSLDLAQWARVSGAYALCVRGTRGVSVQRTILIR